MAKKEKKRRFAKVAKSYSRKVSLKSISSQYDNIECGTFVSSVISFDGEEEFNKKAGIIAQKAFSETERDIAQAMIELAEAKKKDPKSASLGLGDNLSAKDFMESQIEGLEELLETDEDVPGERIDLSESDEEMGFF